MSFLCLDASSSAYLAASAVCFLNVCLCLSCATLLFAWLSLRVVRQLYSFCAVSVTTHSEPSRAEKEIFPQMYGYLTDAVHTSHSFYLYESHFWLHHMAHDLPFIFILSQYQTCLCNSLSLWCPISPSNPFCYDSSPAPCWPHSAPQAETGWWNPDVFTETDYKNPGSSKLSAGISVQIESTV